MTDGGTFGGKYAPQALSLLRIITALLLLQHATAKLFGFPETPLAFPPTMSLLWIAGVIELVGGLLLLVGLFSRPVALLLAGEMAVAYLIVHAPQSIFPAVNQGEAAILLSFACLLIAAAGPGPWSIDEVRSRDPEPGVEGYAAPGGERQYSPEDFGDGKL